MALYLGDKLISSNLAGGDTNPIGSVIAFAGSNAPVGYLKCDGSAVSRETYADLFAVIGTTYGEGDGSTTFNLPNAQGRTLVGVDGSDADFDLADVGGEKTHTLTTDEIPSHAHGFPHSPLAYITGQSGKAANGSTYAWDYITTTNNAGGGQPHNNLQPYLSLNYIIKATHNVTITNVGLAMDFVVEEGTSEGWEYRKWNSGKIIATYNGDINVSGNTSLYGLYRGDFSLAIPSGLFSEIPRCSVTFANNTATLIGCCGEATSTTSISGRVWRGNSSSTYTTGVNVTLEGKWK